MTGAHLKNCGSVGGQYHAVPKGIERGCDNAQHVFVILGQQEQLPLSRGCNRCRGNRFGNLSSRLASGSFLTGGMVVCPCSSNSLGAIASGVAGNLITRAAQVTLKEGRRLILVHREMPVTQIDIRNMLRVSQAGGIICPAAPGFYMRPRTVDDLVDFVVGKVLDLLGVDHTLDTRWQAPRDT